MTTTAQPVPGLQRVPLAKLKASEDNRDVGDVTELAASIKENGIVQPIVAVQENGHFLIVAGARRAAAARKAGLKDVDVIVREFTDLERLLAMAVENVQREDLTALEEAAAYRRLIDEGALTQRALAGKVGKSQGHISKRLALLDLPTDVAAQVDSGGITVADAFELSKIAEHPDRIKSVLEGPNYWPVAHRVELQLEQIEAAKLLKARAEALESQAVPTVEVTNSFNLPRGVHRLTEKGRYDRGALKITAAEHAKHSCHAIGLYVDHSGAVAEFPVCTDRTQHPKIKTLQETETAGQGSTANARVDHDAANQVQTARLLFLRGVLAQKTFPKAELLDLALDGVLRRAHIDGDGVSYAAVMLGLLEPDDTETDPFEALDTYAHENETQRLRAAAAIALADAEAYGFSAWRQTWGDDEAAHLAYLEKHGYEPTKLERDRLPKAVAEVAA